MSNYPKSSLNDIFKKGKFSVINKAGTQEKIKWQPLVFCLDPKTMMGITEDGDWAFEGDAGLFILKSPASFLKIKILLERPLSDILEEIRLGLNEIGVNINPNIFFPYLQIIESALQDMPYWINLALNWYEKLSDEQKVLFKDGLEAVYNNRAYPHELRFRVKKLLKPYYSK